MKTMIAIPAMDEVKTQFFASCIGMQMLPETYVRICQSSLIYDARNKLCEIAVNEGFDRILWLDSDMAFDRDLMQKMVSEHDFVCGVYKTRREPVQFCIYKEFEPGTEAIPFEKCPDTMFEIAGCGFGCVMMSVDLVRKVGEAFGRPFSPIIGLGEDLSFCYRVKALGIPMYCNGSVRLGHVGTKIYY